MNETNFKVALGVFADGIEDFDLNEVFDFICQNSPYFKEDFIRLRNISKESGVQFKPQLIAMTKGLIQKINIEKFEDSQLKQLYLVFLNRYLESLN